MLPSAPYEKFLSKVHILQKQEQSVSKRGELLNFDRHLCN